MQFQPGTSRSASALASMLAAIATVLTAVGCTSSITPLGPDATPMPPQRQLGSAIVVQAMNTQPATSSGGCPAGWGPMSVPSLNGPACDRKLGTPVTLTTASVSSILNGPTSSPVGQTAGPPTYLLMIGVPAADVAAVTAIIKQAYDSSGAVGISVAGKTWADPRVVQPFPGRQLQIPLPSKNLAIQLQHLLIPPTSKTIQNRQPAG